MAQVEEDAREDSDEHDHEQHEPRATGSVREREVTRDHREQHGEREVVVVHRALLGDDAREGIRLASCLLRVDQLPMRRDDVEEDVPRHDGPDHRADLEERRPRLEELRASPRRDGGQHEDQHPEREAVVHEQPAEDVVDDPCDNEQAGADRHGLPRRQVGHLRVDQIGACVEVVEDDHQGEPRQPRRVRLPLEPGEVSGEDGRRDLVLLDVVEAAAVHLPLLATDAVAQILHLRRCLE